MQKIFIKNITKDAENEHRGAFLQINALLSRLLNTSFNIRGIILPIPLIMAFSSSSINVGLLISKFV